MWDGRSCKSLYSKITVNIDTSSDVMGIILEECDGECLGNRDPITGIHGSPGKEA
jgi:hypothetical protein